MKVPTLPEPVKKKTGKKSYQTVVEKTDVMEKQKEKYPETKKDAIPVAKNMTTANDSGFGSGITETQSVQAQSNNNRSGSQSSLRSFTQQSGNQFGVKPKTQSEQLDAANKMATIAVMKTEAKEVVEDKREKEPRQKQGSENTMSSRTSLTDRAVPRNNQQKDPLQAIPTKSTHQTPKKSRLCSLM